MSVAERTSIKEKIKHEEQHACERVATRKAWLVKPAANTNRGVGIKITDSPAKVIALATRPMTL